MGVSYREELKKHPGPKVPRSGDKAPAADGETGGAHPWVEERRALRSQYFKAAAKRHKADKKPAKRLLDA